MKNIESLSHTRMCTNLHYEDSGRNINRILIWQYTYTHNIYEKHLTTFTHAQTCNIYSGRNIDRILIWQYTYTHTLNRFHAHACAQTCMCTNLKNNTQWGLRKKYKQDTDLTIYIHTQYLWKTLNHFHTHYVHKPAIWGLRKKYKQDTDLTIYIHTQYLWKTLNRFHTHACAQTCNMRTQEEI